MRISAHLTARLGLLALGASLAPALAHAQHLARARVVTLSLDPTAHVLDMSPLGSTTPPHWDLPAFDDSSWDRAQAVPPRTLTCVRQRVGAPWTARAAYWGPHLTDAYLIRQPFTLPRAHDYYGSELDLNARAALVVYVNGHLLSTGSYSSNQQPLYAHTERYAISPYLQQGANVIAAYVAVPPLPGAACNGLADTATLRAAGVR